MRAVQLVPLDLEKLTGQIQEDSKVYKVKIFESTVSEFLIMDVLRGVLSIPRCLRTSEVSSEILKIFFNFQWVCFCTCVHECSALGCQKGATESLKLGSPAVVSCLAGVLET